jgi:hypothetical protein
MPVSSVLNFWFCGLKIPGLSIVAGLSRLMMGTPPPKKKGGVLVCLIPLGVEQSWQGDFLSLARNFPWMHYAGAQNRKGVEESY